MKRKLYFLKWMFCGILFLCSLNNVLNAQTVVISPSGPTSFCKGGSVTLCASGASSYVWNVDSTTSCITVNNSGTYAVSGTLANGSTSSASVVVTVNACGILLTKTPSVANIQQGTSTPVNFTYTITNKGSLFSATGNVKDDNGTPGNTADDIVICNYNSLAPGATTSCTRSFNINNTYTNVAIASGSTGTVLIADTATATVVGVPCGVTLSYPDNSNLPRSAVIYNENSVLRASDPGLINCATTGGVIKVWYNDEHALTLGVRRVNIKTASGITTTDYPITATPITPVTVYFPLMGDTISVGDQNGNDVAAGGGRPLWPAIFITDLTTNGAASRIGDWQQGGKGVPPHKISGTWKAAVRLVDYTRSPALVTVTPDPNPAKNNWELGAEGDIPPGGFAALGSEGYGAECAWNVNDLGLIPGHRYRVQFIVHDGDQNKTGGDCGESFTSVYIQPCTVKAESIVSDYNGNNLSCKGASNGFVHLIVNGGKAPYTYSWSVPNTSANLNNIGEGTYAYTVTDSKGCSATDSVVIKAPEQLNALQALSDYQGNNVSCNNSADGFINLTVKGGTAPYSYSWSVANRVNKKLSNIAAGNYTYTVTDANGCSVSNAAVLTAPNPLNVPSTVSDFNGSNVSCAGSTNGFINLSVSGGVGPYTYFWSQGSTTQNLNGIGAGNYTYTVTDNNGCSTSNSVTLLAPGPLNSPSVLSDFHGSNVSCNGATNGFINLSVSGGTAPYSYSWSAGGSTTQNLTNIGAGTYSYTVTDANNCSSSNAVTLAAPNPISIPVTVSSFNGSNVSCSGSTNGFIHLNVSGGTVPYVYSWLPGGSTTQNLDNIGAGTYTYSVTDANGCSSSNSRTLSAPNQLTSPNTVSNFNESNVSCNGSTNGFIHLSVAGGTAPYTYSWSPGGSTSQNLDNIGAGTYTYSVTDANGCSNSNSRTLVAPSPLASPNTVSNFNGSNVSCNGSTNGFIHLTVTGGTAPYSYLWSSGGSTTQNLDNIGAGTYTYSVTDANGCSNSNSRTLVAPNPLASPNTVSNFNGSNVSCNGSTNGFIHLTVSGGTAPYSYLWSPGGSTSQNRDNIGAGTYTYTVTDANGCSNSNSRTLVAPSPLASPNTVSNFNGSNVSCNGSTNGFIHLSVTGGTAPYSYSWSPGGSTTQNLDNIGAGTYTYSVTDVNGCSSNNSRTLVAPNPLASPNTVSNFNGSNVSCNGSANGYIHLSVTGGTAPYSYSWSPGGITTQNLDNIGAGTYTYSVTDANGCSSSNSRTLVAPSPMASPNTVSNFNGSNVSCNGSTNGFINLSVSGGTAPYSYAWSPGGSTTQNLNNIGAGTYSYTVTDANNCTSSNAVTLLAPNPIAIPVTVSNFNGSNVSCNGSTNGFIHLNVSGGTGPYVYTWSPGGSTTQNLNNIGAGTYTYSVTDANGCSSSNSRTLTAPNPMAAPSTLSNFNGSNVSCNGSTNGFIHLSVTGGTAPYSYSWSSGGSTTQNLNNIGAGTYSYTVTDANNCTSSNAATLNAPSPLSTPVTVSNFNGSNISCNGLTNGFIHLNVSGGTGPYVYSWLPGGSTTQNLDNIGAGTYTYSVTDANGCSSTNSRTLTAPNPMASPNTVSDFNGSNVSCFGSTNGFINLSVSGGTAPYSYTWLPGGSTSQNLTNLGAGTYRYTVADANGCMNTNTVVLQAPGALNAPSVVSSYNGSNVSCNGATNGFINLNVTGGKAPYSYAWSPGGSTSQSLTNLGAGTYSYTVTDLNGCLTSNSITLTAPNPLNSPSTVSTYNGSNVSCSASTNGFINLSVSGGTGPYSYFWSPGGSTSQNLNNIGAGTYSYLVTDANGCTSNNAVVLDAPDPLNVPKVLSDFNGSNISCSGSTDGFIHLMVAGGTSPYTYLWSPNGSTSQNLNDLGAGKYTYTVTDANGCIENDSITLTTNNPIQSLQVVSNYNEVNLSCYGSTNGFIHLTTNGGTGPYTYSWSPGGSTSQNLNNIGAGTYVYTVTDVNGCFITNSVTLNSPDPITAPTAVSNYGGSNVSCHGNTNGYINLTVTGGTGTYSYAWSPGGSTTQNLTNIGAGTYSFTVTDINGCTTSNSVTLIEPNPLDAISVVSNFNGSNVSCHGSTNGFINLTPSGGTGTYSYTWTPTGSTSQNLNNIGAGTYLYTVTDINGCSYSNSVTLDAPDTLNAPSVASNYNGTGVSCSGSTNGYVHLSVSGGSTPYAYFWSPVGSTSQDLNNIGAGTYVYHVTDANGCVVTDSVRLTSPNPISSLHATSSNNGFNISCNGGTDGFINETINGGVGPYVYNWTPGNYPTQDLSNIGAGLFVLTVTDANGCVAIDSTTMTEPDLLIVNGVATDALCFGVSNGSVSIAPVGGVPNYSYFWSNGTTSQNIIGLGAGIHTVIITDANGCITSNSFPIVQPNAIASTLSSPLLNGNYNVSCNGSTDGSAGSTAIGGTLPYTYLWSTGQTTQAITNLTAGAYSLIVLDANGCSVANSITLSQPPPINVNAGVDQRICGNATVLEAGNFTNGFMGTWSIQSGTAIISNLNDPHASITGLSYGSNVLQLFMTDGTCSAAADLLIEAFEATAAAAGQSDSLCPKKAGGYLLHATPAAIGTGQWKSDGTATVLNPTNPQSEISGLVTGNNSFVWTVINGPCAASDEIQIYLREQRDCYDGLEMPTAFTPNGDGVNDDFDIHDIERYPFNSLSVFNRWGNKVYFADNYENHQWKGNNTQGEELPDATYFVILVIKDSSIKLHGYVDIRR